MSRPPADTELTHRVEAQLARTNDYFAKLDRTPAAAAAWRRARSRTVTGFAQRIAGIGIALGALVVATIAFGLIVGPIGLGGLFLVGTVMVLAVLGLAMRPGEAPVADYRDDMPNQAVVQRLDSLLARKRAALPAPASGRIDAISAQLPQLESRLAETDILDPLAQDARRLMGRHLPELIERYERVPPAYRHERDGEGLSVDERLISGLDAAKSALDDLGRKLAHEDLTAFETKGRFIESRYKDDKAVESNPPG